MLTKDGVLNVKRILEKTIEFFYSDAYILSVALLTLFFWTSSWQEVGFTLFVLIASFQFVIMRDMTPVIPMLLAIFFMPSNVNAFGNVWIYTIFLPAVVCLIIHFVRFPIKSFKVGKLFLPLLSVAVTMLLGGIFADEVAGYFYGFIQFLGIGIGMLFAYSVLSQYICPPQKVDLKRYLFFTVLVLCIVPSIEMYCIKILGIHTANGRFDFKALGWGDKNFVGYMILVGVPICYYFMVKTKKIIPYFITLVFFLVSAYVTECDGAIGILVFAVPIMTFITYKFLDCRKRELFKILFFILALAVVIELLIICIVTDDFWAVMSKRFLNDTGRTGIYKVAWERFLKYPLFGNGVYYPCLPEAITPINYHSLIFHTLATTGILGFLAYAYLLYARVKVLTAKFNPYNIFAFFSVVLFEMYCFVDCGEFLMIIIFINVIVLLTERINEQPSEKHLKALKVFK